MPRASVAADSMPSGCHLAAIWHAVCRHLPSRKRDGFYDSERIQAHLFPPQIVDRRTRDPIIINILPPKMRWLRSRLLSLFSCVFTCPSSFTCVLACLALFPFVSIFSSSYFFCFFFFFCPSTTPHARAFAASTHDRVRRKPRQGTEAGTPVESLHCGRRFRYHKGRQALPQGRWPRRRRQARMYVIKNVVPSLYITHR